MNFTKEKRNKFTKWIIGIATACILIFLGVQNIDVVAKAVSWVVNLILPLILGFVFALILNVPLCFFESYLFRKNKKVFIQKLRRPLSLVLSIILIVSIFLGVIWLVIPELINAVKIIAHGAMEFAKNILKMKNDLSLSEIPFGGLIENIDWEQVGSNLETWLKDQSGTIMNTAVGTVGSLIGGITNFFIALIFSVYILLNKEVLKKQVSRLVRAWLPEKFGEWLIHASSVCSGIFRNFVSGQTLEAIILGMLCMIGMFILQIPYAPMVGALVGVGALIPMVGAFVAAIVGAFMILTVSPIKAVIFVVFIIILQQIEGNLIYPKVMGSRINLPSIWVLAAVTIGGGLAGPVGMLLCIPVFSTIYVLVREATEMREKKIAYVQKSESIVASKKQSVDNDSVGVNK